jgi:hypothetical protein
LQYPGSPFSVSYDTRQWMKHTRDNSGVFLKHYR